ncbi:MAG: SAM-dependent methyltransferase [Myxococcota bacterium]
MFKPVEWDPKRPLTTSRYVSTFAHMGEVYVYHDLYGYILKMSADILAFLQGFATPVLAETVCGQFSNAFGDQAPEGFIGTFAQFGCLVHEGDDEHEGIWDKVPVRGAWNVWERTEDGLTLYTAWGERPLTTHTLTCEEAAIWDRFDGETPLFVIAEDHPREVLADLIARLVHHDVQAVKLGHARMSFYESRQHMAPPYLTSTMPYAAYDAVSDPEPVPLDERVSPEGYYASEIPDADVQFDHQETTLSHLFRDPHPALGGQTFGQALVAGLKRSNALPSGEVLRVLEIGGGLGYFARAVVEALQSLGRQVTYEIIELSPTLAAAQRERTVGLPVTIHEGNVLERTWPSEQYDLILANEMIGDLPSARMTHSQAGLDREDLEGDAYQAFLAERGPGGAMAARYTLGLGDAPDPFYLNVGAMELVAKVAQTLAPGGTAYLSEFGEMSRWPVLSTHLDHPELSIHFGHLAAVARAEGLADEFVFVMDLIDMARDVEGLRTTRSYFRALTGLLAARGVTLEKRGYTREMFNTLLSGVDMDTIGDISFDRIEDRLMGLVPHEFKALVLQNPEG